MKSTENLKFLCSYGGRILPRPSDGLLRYVGGHTRVLSVPRSVSYSDLIAKISEMCGYSAALRCQLPSEEMDVLVSVKSDEDLKNIIDEYNRASSLTGKELKIKSVLSPPKSPSQSRSSNSSISSTDSCRECLHSPTQSDFNSPRSPIDSRYMYRNLQFPHRSDWAPYRPQAPCRQVQARYMPILTGGRSSGYL